MSEEEAVQRAERRSARREAFRRPVVFAGVRGEGLLRHGMAADISASGLLVHTMQPEVPGRHLEIEIHPDGAVKPGDVIMLRGEVMWTRPQGGRGEYAMGVRFMQSFPATDVTGPGYRPATRAESRELAASIRRRLAVMEPAAQVEFSAAALKKSAEPAPAPKRPNRGRRYLPFALLLLLIAFLVSSATLGALWGLGFFHRDGARAIDSASPSDDPLRAAQDDPATPQADDPVAARIEEIREAGPSYHLNRGSLYLIQGRFPAAGQAFRRAREHVEAEALERFIAEVGEAQALAGGGDVAGALEVLRAEVLEPAAIPTAWKDLRAAFMRDLAEAPNAPESAAPLVNAFAFQPPARADGGSEAADSTGTRIEIDTTRHLLTLLKDNAIAAVYPIGLGASGKTPEGDFAVINKIENPDWYNGGDVVPAGAPENELGSRWLGLGDGEGPTPIGIHATDEIGSIGGNESRGCIRMRPADVEDLFKHVDVGTPVRIRPR